MTWAGHNAIPQRRASNGKMGKGKNWRNISADLIAKGTHGNKGKQNKQGSQTKDAEEVWGGRRCRKEVGGIR